LTAAVGLESAWGSARFNGGVQLNGLKLNVGENGLLLSIDPHARISVPVGGAQVFVAVARASEFPDLQFSHDLVVDDPAAGGRFRKGNGVLGYENVFWQELGVGARAWRDGSVRVTVYHREFSNLVVSSAAVIPDSSQVVNAGASSIVGVELRIERRLKRMHLAAVADVGSMQFGAINGLYPDPILKTDAGVRSIVLMARGPLPARVEGGVLARYRSHDPLSGIPLVRQQAEFVIDALLQRRFSLGPFQANIYIDARNILDRRSGADLPPASAIEAMAQQAYARAPGSIPYESPRYRAAADLDGNGRVEGATELLPQFRQAARDYAVPITSYVTPRTARLGLAITF
jgi:hypothetical protein